MDPIPKRADVLDPRLGAVDGELAVPVAGQEGRDALPLSQQTVPVCEPAWEVVNQPITHHEGWRGIRACR